MTNLLALVRELVILVPIAGAVWAWRRRSPWSP
jgi:hypothetical protein